MKTVGETLGRDKKFHEGAEKIDKANLVGNSIILIDAEIIEEWESRNGLPDSDFALLAFKKPGEKEIYTTSIGGQVIMKEIRKIIKSGDLEQGIQAVLNIRDSEENPGKSYYTFR